MKMEKPKKIIEVKKIITIGVVGYSPQKFNELTAHAFVNDAFNLIQNHYQNCEFSVCSGLTNIGIPKIAYENAIGRGWKTIGIAPKCSEEYEWFPCDQHHIVGESWGDESEAFIDNLDILLKIGGGKQSEREMEMAKEKGLKILHYDM